MHRVAEPEQVVKSAPLQCKGGRHLDSLHDSAILLASKICVHGLVNLCSHCNCDHFLACKLERPSRANSVHFRLATRKAPSFRKHTHYPPCMRVEQTHTAMYRVHVWDVMLIVSPKKFDYEEHWKSTATYASRQLDQWIINGVHPLRQWSYLQISKGNQNSTAAANNEIFQRLLTFDRQIDA